eukprot:1155000-Pelagomonas_calceolata.AAC.8
MLKMHALNRAIPGSFSTKQRSSCAFAGPSAPLKSKRTLPVLKAAQEARQEADGSMRKKRAMRTFNEKQHLTEFHSKRARTHLHIHTHAHAC